MLANRIKYLRINAGMSQLQLAKKLNLSPSAVGMYEQGRRMPAIETIIQIAKLFDVSLDYLILGSEAYCSITNDHAVATQHVCQRRPCCIYNNQTEVMCVLSFTKERHNIRQLTIKHAELAKKIEECHDKTESY